VRAPLETHARWQRRVSTRAAANNAAAAHAGCALLRPQETPSEHTRTRTRTLAAAAPPPPLLLKLATCGEVQLGVLRAPAGRARVEAPPRS
jgi:hypothetical protein